VRARSACAVVLNWNLPDLTIRCVDALTADGLPPERIVVVDNGSTDDSIERLHAALPPNARLLELHQNTGFARGCNLGAAEIEASAYLFVNNDAFVHRPGSIEALLEALNRPEVGIAVPRLLNEDLSLQRNVVPLPRPSNALVRALGISRFVRDRWQPHWGTYWAHGCSRRVEAANGAVVAIRGTLWRDLCGYSEWTWMFSEDLDLCWRAAKRGFATWYERDAEFVHIGNASGRSLFAAEQRSLRVARSDAAMIRSGLDPARAVATIAIFRLAYLARALLFGTIGQRARAREARAAARGYSLRERTADDPPTAA
jgi:N-acetylglucosaminyl-diphospho-decaprenol L-rhamnosyltransferase